MMGSNDMGSNEKGAALLTVLVALMVITIMLFEFQYAAMVERKLAYNELNQIQAYYLAKTGARLGLLRICLYTRAKRDGNIKNLLKQVPQASGFIDAIWNLPLPAFPPDEARLDELSAPDKDAAETVLNKTKVSDGKSTHVITDESTKINLNDLVVSQDKRNDRIDFREDNPQGPFWYTGRILINLMENFLRDSENPNEEYGDLRPEEVVYDIMDWVTPGDNRFSGGNKDSFYEKLSPPYKAKKNKFYTVEELRMVKGIDEHLLKKLKPHVTVYADQGKVNINTTNREDFYRALLPNLRPEDVKKIIEERDKRMGWSSEEDFAKYITDTFGAADFQRRYPKKEDYPFTVTSQSFLIEAMGKLDRSKSSIQKSIRVAVSLKSTGPSCETADPTKCSGVPGCFLHPVTGRCMAKARTQRECFDNLASSTFYQDGAGKQCCKIQILNAEQEICYDPKTEAPKGPVDPNAVKIVYWSEA